MICSFKLRPPASETSEVFFHPGWIAKRNAAEVKDAVAMERVISRARAKRLPLALSTSVNTNRDRREVITA